MRRRLDLRRGHVDLQGVELVAEDLRPAADAGQRRLQVVGDGAGEGLELATVGAFLGDVVDDDDRHRPAAVLVRAVQRQRAPPRGSPAARSPGRCAGCPPRAPCSPCRARACGMLVALDGGTVQPEDAVVVGTVLARLSGAGPSAPRRPGCASSPRPSPRPPPGRRSSRSSPRRGARRATWPAPRTRVTRACSAARSLAPRESSSTSTAVTSDVDLHDDGARGQVLDRAERSATRLGPEHREGREDQRVDRADGGGEPVADPGRGHHHQVGDRQRLVAAEEHARLPASRPRPPRRARSSSAARASGTRSASQPRRACARKSAVSRPSTAATTTKVLQVLRTTQP